jgi:peroxiredoxin/outer membrane lipoprotein-sorting protein
MKKKIFVFVFIVSVVFNVAIILTFGYLWASNNIGKKPEKQEIEDSYRQNYWMLKVILDVPGLDPHAVQLVRFDYDPIPDFCERVKNYRFIYNKVMQSAESEKERIGRRRAAMRICWDNIFADITGDKLLMIKDGIEWNYSGTEDTQWIVTKVAYLNKEPICWCIPFRPGKSGEEGTIVLNQETAFNLTQVFDEMIASGEVSEKTHYPAEVTFKDETKARRIYNKMITTVAKSKTLYYESAYWKGPEGSEFLYKTTYKIWMKKPNYVRLEATENNKVIGTLVGDGEYLWMTWGNKNITFEGENYIKYNNTTYAQIPIEKNRIAGLLIGHVQRLKSNLSGLPLMPTIFYMSKNTLDEHYMSGVMGHGSEIINGEKCDIIEVCYSKIQMSYYYWISQNDFLPRKILYRLSKDLNYIQKEIWVNVFINMNIPNSTFIWKPPQGWTKYTLPGLNDALLDVGSIAPDFEVTLIDSSKLKLSELRGKTILLYFWEVSSVRDSKEMSLFQEYYDKYKDRGFVVIAINSWDSNHSALKYLQENAITYPNVVGAKMATHTIRENLYQKPVEITSSPLGYIIGPDGKIVDAWFGFDEDRVVSKLKSLGFD